MNLRECLLMVLKGLSREEVEEFAVLSAVLLSYVGALIESPIVIAAIPASYGYTQEQADHAGLLSKKVRDRVRQIQLERN